MTSDYTPAIAIIYLLASMGGPCEIAKLGIRIQKTDEHTKLSKAAIQWRLVILGTCLRFKICNTANIWFTELRFTGHKPFPRCTIFFSSSFQLHHSIYRDILFTMTFDLPCINATFTHSLKGDTRVTILVISYSWTIFVKIGPLKPLMIQNHTFEWNCFGPYSW